MKMQTRRREPTDHGMQSCISNLRFKLLYFFVVNFHNSVYRIENTIAYNITKLLFHRYLPARGSMIFKFFNCSLLYEKKNALLMDILKVNITLWWSCSNIMFVVWLFAPSRSFSIFLCTSVCASDIFSKEELCNGKSKLEDLYGTVSFWVLRRF